MINRTNFKKPLLLSAILTVTTAFSGAVEAREQIRIVGSSTVYPFVTVAAESFSDKTGNRTPIVESTGTGGGFKIFCQGVGEDYPDFTDASRAVKQSEIDLCAKNGVKDITEIKIGYDGVVLANSNESTHYNLTKNQIFLALAKNIPVDGKLVANNNKKWSDIDPSLPDVAIEVYGPPPTSGTRDAFVELVMEKGCKDTPEFKAAYPDEKQRKKACHVIREDGAYIEAGENDNLIVQKLSGNKNSLGIFGFSFLEENGDSIQGSIVEGSEPTFENISSGEYAISRPLFIYAKDANSSIVKGMGEFAAELTSDEAIGQEGYLLENGLIPLHVDELKKVQEKVKSMK